MFVSPVWFWTFISIITITVCRIIYFLKFIIINYNTIIIIITTTSPFWTTLNISIIFIITNNKMPFSLFYSLTMAFSIIICNKKRKEKKKKKRAVKWNTTNMVYKNAELANAGISLVVAYSLTFWVERSNNWKCVCSRRVEIREDIIYNRR